MITALTDYTMSPPRFLLLPGIASLECSAIVCVIDCESRPQRQRGDDFISGRSGAGGWWMRLWMSLDHMEDMIASKSLNETILNVNINQCKYLLWEIQSFISVGLCLITT